MDQQFLFHPNREELTAAANESPPPSANRETEGDRRKREGMDAAAHAQRDLLAFARDVAVLFALANKYGAVTADDVAEALAKAGKPGLGNAAGSLFLGKGWEWTGLFAKSKRPEAHSNLLRVWRRTDYFAQRGGPPAPLPQGVRGVIDWPPP